MADDNARHGVISWADLTVTDADHIRDFYAQVVDWKISPVDMGGYNDYCMLPEGSDIPVAGICHARGGNAGLPSQWLIYITVTDLEASLARCKELGGKVIAGPKKMGGSQYAVIQDPSGAVAALYEKGD
jgi:predicted enzyme related to lactoylglutathione lyase